MRYSQMLIPTLKEDPSEASVVSHRLMLRAGLIRPLSAGIYTWLPLGLRVLNRVADIVRQEMDGAGAQEILMPAVQPAELWQESGRWDYYGKELLRFQDRHDRPYCFGPTHEEVVSDLVRREIRSYRQLPANFYQIQTKFRDEIRPRFGIMRGREFLMKDGYSFDLDEAGLEVSYQAMYAAYQRIFRRCGLKFRAVEADTGAIGGAYSHEFHVLADSGEDGIAACDQCGYGANVEKATCRRQETVPSGEAADPLERVATPDQRTIDEVRRFLNVPVERMVKSLVVESDRGAFLLLLRGDHELNEVKAKAALQAQWLLIPTPERVKELTGVSVGSLGPVGATLPVVADEMVQTMQNFVCGANDEGWHMICVNFERDLPLPLFADLRNVTAGEGCPRCATGKLSLQRGIEVGHVFKLGLKYSQSLGLKVLNVQGVEVHPLMGCYGIGVSRIVAAAIEQHYDERGIRWPLALAPFAVEILLVNPKEEEAMRVADGLYQGLRQRGVSVLLDDRDERIGVKFKDADLLGGPMRVVVGGRSLKEGQLEVQWRRGGEPGRVAPNAAVEMIVEQLRIIATEEEGA